LVEDTDIEERSRDSRETLELSVTPYNSQQNTAPVVVTDAKLQSQIQQQEAVVASHQHGRRRSPPEPRSGYASNIRKTLVSAVVT
jgi:hypothetical protein